MLFAYLTYKIKLTDLKDFLIILRKIDNNDYCLFSVSFYGISKNVPD